MKIKKCLLLGGLLAGTALTASARNNVVLFIADGMGTEHVKAARAYVNGGTAPLIFETLGDEARVITTKPNGSITDSATAATAMATGYQHDLDGIISMGYNNEIKTTLVEWAQGWKMRGGIVTTDDIGGATPGAFGAHEPDRTRMDEIRSDYLQYDKLYKHNPSLPHILFGGGYNEPNYVTLAQSLGYDFISSATDLASNNSTNRMLGLFGSGSWAPMTPMLSRQDATQPTLSQMVAKAMERLVNANGFFLVVESANIDKLCHVNDSRFVAEIAELDEAVKAALAWGAQHTAMDDLLILVTADHETGGVTVPDQKFTAGTIPNVNWGSTAHTAAQVPLYANTFNMVDGATLDNTEIFYLAQDGLMYRQGGVAPVITGLTVSGITGTEATVQWTTAEPSTSVVELKVAGAVVKQVTSPGRATAHTVLCSGLIPGSAYEAVAKSSDFFQATGTASSSFATPGSDLNAYVYVQPIFGPGTVSGSVQGLRVAGDGQTQVITESTDGAGLGLAVQYTLQTPVAGKDMDSLTINANTTWTLSDGTADGLIAAIRVLGPQGASYWQPIAKFPFVASPPSSYADDQGNILVRFEDGASIRRERQDKLTIDLLYGEVIANTKAPVLPTGAIDTQAIVAQSALSVNLAWSDCNYETGYQVWRNADAAGWILLTNLLADSISFQDTKVVGGSTYSYIVRAFNTDGYYDAPAVSATVPVVLMAPTGLKAVQGKTGITVSWIDNNTSETGYEVLKGTAIDNYSQTISTAANAKSYVDKTYVKGATYYYTVRAFKNTASGKVTGPTSVDPTSASVTVR